MLLNRILQLKGYPIEAAQGKLNSLLQLSPEELSQWQERQKWQILQHHYDTTPWYRKRIGDFPGDWNAVPILQKKDYQAPLPQLLSQTVHPKNIYIGNTSGSSGHPFFFAKDKFCHAMTWANIEYLYQLHGISFRDKQARFYGIPINGWGYWKEKAKDKIANRVRFPVFDLSDTTLEKWIVVFKKNEFQYLYGYTSALVCFARFCISRNLVLKDVCRGLKICIVTSEVCTEEDKQTLAVGFGVPIVNEYGASEADIIAFSYPNEDWRISATNVFIEVVDQHGYPLPVGQEGKILVTALFNRAMPVIRYEIGDIGILSYSKDKLLILEKLLGRVNDMIELPSGRKAAGLTFYYISRSILEKSGVLREFIIRQTALDTFVLEAVTDRELTRTEIAAIQTQMDVYLEPGLRLTIHRVPEIKRTGSGKIKHFYSMLSRNN